MCKCKEDVLAYLYSLRSRLPRKYFGMDYVIESVLHPWCSVSSSELRNMFNHISKRNIHCPLPVKEDGPANCNDLTLSYHTRYDTLDEEAVKQFKQAVSDAYDEYYDALECNDDARLADAKHLLEQYAYYYKISFQKNGKPRQFDNQPAKDYRAVYQAIHEIYDIILHDRICMYCYIKSHLHIGLEVQWRGEEPFP